MAELTDIREAVRERYAAGAHAIDGEQEADCGCGPATVFGGSLYDETDGAPDGAVQASLGCGVPTAVADLHPGETVLDLGSGAGADVLISARRVGDAGRAIGLDMTDEMLAVARANPAAAGVPNAEFVKGYIEAIPLPDASVDMDAATRADMAAWTGCIAGALTEDEFRTALAAAGLADIEIRETHRVHAHAGSAIVRARKP